MNKISSQISRKIALGAQLLDSETQLAGGKHGISQIIAQLGYIQIDTIAVINRSHHHTLWARQNSYHEKILHELQAKDRMIFEYWSHAMSYLPMSDYRYFLPRMQNFKNPTSKWAEYQLGKCRHLLKPVLERIRKEGPLSSKDFSQHPEKKGGTWWDWKPAKVALELLFWQGELMVSKRSKFQKFYDLTERVIPEGLNTTFPGENEVAEFLVRRALSALGIADVKQINQFMQPAMARDSDLQVAGKDIILKTLNQFIEEKEILPVLLEHANNSIYYAFKDAIEKAESSKDTPPRISILSPFDNLIIQRERTAKLFDFNYTLECYVPEVKRKFGYFVLPVLWGDNFVGRFDSKAIRKEKTFYIKNLVFERLFNSFDNFLPLFAKKLVDLARFNDCNKVIFDKVTPAKIKNILVRQIKKEIAKIDESKKTSSW